MLIFNMNFIAKLTDNTTTQYSNRKWLCESLKIDQIFVGWHFFCIQIITPLKFLSLNWVTILLLCGKVSWLNVLSVNSSMIARLKVDAKYEFEMEIFLSKLFFFQKLNKISELWCILRMPFGHVQFNLGRSKKKIYLFGPWMEMIPISSVRSRTLALNRRSSIISFMCARVWYAYAPSPTM